MSLQVRPLSYALGAEITGVDIRKPLDDTTFKDVHDAFLEYSVLLFRGQALTRDQHVAFSRHFGDVDNNDASPRIRDPEYHELQLIINKPQPDAKPTVFAGQVWHSDQSYSCRPALATLLRCVEAPGVGGDTMFSNMYLAYDMLSDVMKKLVENLEGVHFGGKARLDTSTAERAAETRKLNPPAVQPVVDRKSVV